MGLEIKSLTLVFPHGVSSAQCQKIAIMAEEIVDCRVSEGGYTVTKMPWADDEKMEFAEDQMCYVYGYKSSQVETLKKP